MLGVQGSRLVHATRILTGRLRPSPLIARKLVEMRRLPKGGAAVLGNSIPHGAFAPAQMAHPAYNACIDRAQADTLLRWWHIGVRPLLQPRHLVVAFCGFEFNANSESRDAWHTALSQADSLLTWLDQPGPQRLLSAVLTQAGRRARLSTAGNHAGVGTQGWCASYMHRTDQTSDAMWRVARGFYADYTLSDRLLGALDQLLAHAQDHGCRVTLVRHTMREELVSLFPRGARDLAEVWSEIAAISKDRGVAVLESPPLKPKVHYADAIHLNRVGMALSSAWLDAVLNDALDAH